MSLARKQILALILVAGLSQVALSQSAPGDWSNRLLDKDPKVRATAEAALVKGGQRSLPLLRRFLTSEQHEELHGVTFEIMRRIGPPAIPALVDLLQHEWIAIRRSAIDELIDLAPHTQWIQPAL